MQKFTPSKLCGRPDVCALLCKREVGTFTLLTLACVLKFNDTSSNLEPTWRLNRLNLPPVRYITQVSVHVPAVFLLQLPVCGPEKQEIVHVFASGIPRWVQGPSF